MEIISEEQNKVKRMKRTEDSLETSETIPNTPIFELQGSQNKKRKRKCMRKFWRDCSRKFPQHGKGDRQSSPRGKKSPVEDKPKEKHTNTHTNQTNKDGHKERILKASREKQQVTRETPTLIFQ